MFTWTRSFLENLQKLCKFTLLEVLPLHSTTKTKTKTVVKECKLNQESNNLLSDLSPNPSWNTNEQTKTKVGGEERRVKAGAVMNFFYRKGKPEIKRSLFSLQNVENVGRIFRQLLQRNTYFLRSILHGDVHTRHCSLLSSNVRAPPSLPPTHMILVVVLLLLVLVSYSLPRAPDNLPNPA